MPINTAHVLVSISQHYYAIMKTLKLLCYDLTTLYICLTPELL